MAKDTMLSIFQKAREAYVAARNDVTAKMIADALAEFIPEGRMLVWSQYTPYFQDGDPCTFGVNEPCLQPDEDFMDPLDPWEGEYIRRAEYEVLHSAWKDITSDETLMEAAFGDHVAVAVRRSGEFRTSDHSHD